VVTVLAVVSLGISAAAVGAQGQQRPVGDGPVGGTLVAGALFGLEPKGLNPNIRRDDGALRVAALVYCALVWTDVPNRTGVYPALAQRWETNANATAFTFHLHPNAKWHDGRPVTAADVVWSFREVIDKKGAAYDSLADVRSVEAVGDGTVVITLGRPDAAFPARMGSQYAPYVMPRHLFAGSDWTTNPHNNKPVGCGPFKFVEWEKGSHIALDANREFFMGRPHLDRLIVRFLSLENLLSAFEAGEVKYSYEPFPASEFVRLRRDRRFRLDLYDSSIAFWMGFNLQRKPFDDVRVRTAFAQAVDRWDISRRAYLGLSPANWGTMPKSWAYDARAEFKYDPRKAAELLEEAGLRPGPDGVRLRTTLTIPTVLGFPNVAVIVREHLSRVGIEATIQSMDWASYVSRAIEQKNFEIGVGGGFAGPDPSEFEPFVMTGGYRNMMGYSNRALDDLFAQARATSKVEERTRHYREIQRILIRDVPRINLVSSQGHHPIWASFKRPFWDKSLVGKPYNPYHGFLHTYLAKE
jgi:peptide/nickel transport system substrate-binding protein